MYNTKMLYVVFLVKDFLFANEGGGGLLERFFMRLRVISFAEKKQNNANSRSWTFAASFQVFPTSKYVKLELTSNNTLKFKRMFEVCRLLYWTKR